MRICRPIEAGHSFIRVPTPPIRLPARPPLANLDVWKTEPVATRIRSLEAMHRTRLERFKADPRFGNVRQTGTIVALDLNVPAAGYLSEAGPKLRAFFQRRNLLIRPLGNVIYLMTPYCVTADDLDRTYDAIDEAADMFAGGADESGQGKPHRRVWPLRPGAPC